MQPPDRGHPGVTDPRSRAPGSAEAPWVRQPEPTGPPTRAPLIVGSVGHFLAVGGVIAYGIVLYLSTFADSFVVLLFVGPFLAGTLLVQLSGFWGLRRNYGSRMGLATFSYGLIAVVLFLVANTLFATFGPGTSTVIVLFVASLVALGIMFILQGIAFILVRHFMRSAGLSLATGILFIIVGSLIALVFTAIFGGFFALVAPMVMGGITLALARVPPWPAPYAPEAAAPAPAPGPPQPAPPSFPPAGPAPAPQQGPSGTVPEAESLMRDLSTKIEELERAIKEQEAFLSSLEERLVEGVIDNATYSQVRQNRTDHLNLLREELEHATQQLRGPEGEDRGAGEERP